MVFPFNILQIEPTNDEKIIKRAYAQLIKQCRPDENPHEFQALNEAYQAALKWAGDNKNDLFHSEFNDGSVFTRSHEPSCLDDDYLMPERHSLDLSDNAYEEFSLESDHHPFDTNQTKRDQTKESEKEDIQEATKNNAVALNSNNLHYLYDHLLTFSPNHTPENLTQWLNSEQSFWNLDHKEHFGHYLLHRLYHDEPPLHYATFETLDDFFGFHYLNPSFHQDQSLILSEQLHLNWSDIYTKAEREIWQKNFLGNRFYTLLTQPFRWRDFIIASFPPWRALQRSEKVLALNHDESLYHYEEDSPYHTRDFNPEQIEKWRSILISPQRFAWPKTIVQLHQLALLLIATPIITALLCGVFGDSFTFDPHILYAIKSNTIKLVVIMLLLIVTFPSSHINERSYFQIQYYTRIAVGLFSLLFLYSTILLTFAPHAEYPALLHQEESYQTIVNKVTGKGYQMPTEADHAALYQAALDFHLQDPNDQELNRLILLHNANSEDETLYSATYFLLKQRLTTLKAEIGTKK